MELVSVNVDQMPASVTINNFGMKINAGLNAKNWLMKVYVIKDLFGIQVIAECERAKLCDIGDYLDYENCKCRKKLFDKLVEECTETNNEVKLAKITLFENENKYKRSSCTPYIVLFLIIFTINMGIGTYFISRN